VKLVSNRLMWRVNLGEKAATIQNGFAAVATR
jgi:hypothetical protein